MTGADGWNEIVNSTSAGSVVAAIKYALKGRMDPVVALKDSFSGWTVLVVSAGPSAKRWRQVYDSLEGACVAVLCVKQAIEIDDLADKCNIHVCNAWNLRRYHYKRKDILRVYVDDDTGGRSYQKWDIRFMIRKRGKGPQNSVAAMGDWEDWTFKKTGLQRPWGPGLMYEGVFHTLMHCGFKSIHTVGWDIADAAGNNQHFYDAPKTSVHQMGSQPWIDRTSILQRLQRLGSNFWWFATGKNYNKAVMMEGEAEMVANSVSALRGWLKSEGVSLTIHSESHWIVQDLPT